MSLKRALVAVDLRGATTEVVKAAIELVAPHGAEIVLFNVVSAAPGVNPFGEAPDGRTNEAILNTDAFTDLEPFALMVERAGVPVVRDLGHGDPVRAIMAAIGRHEPGLVVVGTHARSGVSRLLLGSVAESVLRVSPVPVLVVRSPATGIDPGE
jgi:nucleotide-binding universal stress UspA family protein